MDKRRLLSRQTGDITIEAIVSVALLASVIIMGVAAVGLAARSAMVNERENTGIRLLHTQLESVKNAPFVPAGTPYATVVPPAGYAVTLGSSQVPGLGASEIALIHVNVIKDGAVVRYADMYKVNRP